MSALLMALIVAASPAEEIAELHAVCQDYRKQCRLAEQSLDDNCCRMAQAHAERMAAMNWMHHGPNDQIVAWGSRTPLETARMWAGSPGHNAWLLSSANLCGWGYAVSRSGSPYWCGVFRRGAPTGSPLVGLPPDHSLQPKAESKPVVYVPQFRQYQQPQFQPRRRWRR
jgi:hypothetical protein